MIRLIIDTHAFIWWNNEPHLLSRTAQAALTDPANLLYLSIVSVWEMQIKVQLGKLSLPPSLPAVVERNRTINRVHLLGVTPEHIYALDGLPAIHKDPFDRLLIAQTLVEGATLLTADTHITAYPVTTLW